MPTPATDNASRFARLTTLLGDTQPLWRPLPFRESRPAWCARYPHLAEDLLGLDESTVQALAGDDRHLGAWLAQRLPELAELPELLTLPASPAAPLRHPGRHFDWAIPGRKRAQIEAFAAAVGPPAAPLIDCCAGKGHLGRFFAAQWHIDVDSIDVDAALVDAGARLARRARQGSQRVAAGDVLADDLADRLAGRHVVALHACGDLHRRLVGAAAGSGAVAIDLSPCCYQRTQTLPLHAFCGSTALALGRDDLRLAVTGSATEAPRQTRRRQRENAWKLGFMSLLSAAGDFVYRPLRPIPTSWLDEDFVGFCRLLAAREAITLPPAPAWQSAEAAGRARWHDAKRLNLLRLGFRRAIEVWLALDMLLHLEAAGWSTRLSEFCPPALTPRNLLLSARR